MHFFVCLFVGKTDRNPKTYYILFLPLNSYRTFMYCDQRSQYIRQKSKKRSFRGNYMRKYGTPISVVFPLLSKKLLNKTRSLKQVYWLLDLLSHIKDSNLHAISSYKYHSKFFSTSGPNIFPKFQYQWSLSGP